MASILINESLTSEFQFHCGLKQRDPLAPYLFILIMESLHLSFSRSVEAGIFSGIKIDSSLTIFYLFYADDAVFIGVGVSNANIAAAAASIGCSVMKTPFKYLGVMVGEYRWVWDMNGEGVFRFKDVCNLLDEYFLPKEHAATRWIKSIPIKINVFAWKLHLDRIPTRMNLVIRGVQIPSTLCSIYCDAHEDTSRLFFSCGLAIDVTRLICRWWNLAWTPFGSYSDWLSWFKSIRLGSKIKGLLEGVFYVTWWCLWNFINQLLFAAQNPRREVLFDDIVTHSFS
uniref:RNA-directed DNA polymerase, eukaryota n=1 Tax=Tanacetum cinerariifolium TaxID=118510 RepID=A0A699I3Q3_TANCI|nr:RNA-directed DNA polymerase, eukaryota [Tanacetum cinerariifolium]